MSATARTFAQLIGRVKPEADNPRFVVWQYSADTDFTVITDKETSTEYVLYNGTLLSSRKVEGI
jgi:hypothetical protein